MTDLRDARLAKALEHAPDAQDAPTAVTRDAIKKVASNAIDARANRPVEPHVSWWRALWVQSGRRGGPWPAAFATVVLGGIITLLWHGREVPDEKPERKVAQAPLPARAPAPAVTVGGPAASTADAAKSGQAASKVSPEPAAVAKAARPAPTPPAHMAGAPAAAPSAHNSMALLVPPVTEAAPPRPAALPAPAQPAPELNVATGTNKALQDATTAPPRAAVGAAMVPPAAPAPASIAESAAPAELSGRSAAGAGAVGRMRAQVPALDAWTSADLAYGGRSAQLERPRAQPLVSRVQALVAAAPTGSLDATQGASLMRLQVLAPGGVLATFELWFNGYRWQAAGAREVSGSLKAEDVSSLLALAATAMPP